MACSKLVRNLKKIKLFFFPFVNLLQGRYLIIKKYSFLFYVAKSISFEVMTSIAIFNLETWNFKTKQE